MITKSLSSFDPSDPYRVAKDPYENGTCYERPSHSKDWQLDCGELPYLSYVKRLSSSWKPLQYLADWMEVGTTPLRWQELKFAPGAQRERFHRTNIRSIEYSSDGQTRESHIDSSDLLNETLIEMVHRPDEVTLQLFVVEDLSQQVIEMFGSAFDIDPFFFREHIVNYNWYNTRDPWTLPPNLTANLKRRNWLRLRNLRVRYHHGHASFVQAQRETSGYNVLRRPDDDGNFWPYGDEPGSVISLTRSATSIWVGKGAGKSKVKVGIILVDPSPRCGKPLWYGPANWRVPPSARDELTPESHHPDTPFEYMIQAIQDFPRQPIQDQNWKDSHVFTIPALNTICAEWLLLCDYAKARLSQIEWEVEKPETFRVKGSLIDQSLHRLHIWRRIIPMLREMVRDSCDYALPAAQRLTPAIQGRTVTFEDVRIDLERIERALDELQARVDRMTSVVTSQISIENSRRGLIENQNLARLTWLATTFIPLSFVTGLFSMQSSLASIRDTFVWYTLTAVPLLVMVLIIAGGVGKGWWKQLHSSIKTKVCT